MIGQHYNVESGFNLAHLWEVSLIKFWNRMIILKLFYNVLILIYILICF